MMNVYVGLGAGRTLDGLRAIAVYHQKQVISLSGGHPCFYILLCWGFSPDDAEADSIDFKLAPSKRLSHLQNVDRVMLMIFQMRKYFKTTLNHILFLIIAFQKKKFTKRKCSLCHLGGYESLPEHLPIVIRSCGPAVIFSHSACDTRSLLQ